MEEIFDLYGFALDDLEECRQIVERTLSLRMAPHESSSTGDYFRWGEPYGEEIILQKNFDPVEGEYAEKAYKDTKILLYVNSPQDAESVKQRLSADGGVIFLERR